MLIELQGVTLNVLPGRTDGMAHVPRECPCCHTMTSFFTNRQGETVGTCCAEKGVRYENHSRD